jgi:predicted nucleic acid-binding protein
MPLLLDTNLLRRLCHPTRHRDVRGWFGNWLSLAQADREVDMAISAAADYELRRGYLWKLDRHDDERKALARIDSLCELIGVQPISEGVLKNAARMWADARRGGYSTASERDIDWDVIVAAQAEEISAVVVTSNAQHLSRYGVDARDWDEVPVPKGPGSA